MEMGQVPVQSPPISRYGPSLSGRSQSVTKPTFLWETQAAFLHPDLPHRETRLAEIKHAIFCRVRMSFFLSRSHGAFIPSLDAAR